MKINQIGHICESKSVRNLYPQSNITSNSTCAKQWDRLNVSWEHAHAIVWSFQQLLITSTPHRHCASARVTLYYLITLSIFAERLPD